MKNKKAKFLKFGKGQQIIVRLIPESHTFPDTKGMCSIIDSIDCPFCKAGLPTKEVIRKDG